MQEVCTGLCRTLTSLFVRILDHKNVALIFAYNALFKNLDAQGCAGNVRTRCVMKYTNSYTYVNVCTRHARLFTINVYYIFEAR